MDKIKEKFNDFKNIKNIKIYLVCFAFLLLSVYGVSLLFSKISNLKSENALISNNLSAEKDSVRVLHLKNGNLVSEKTTWQYGNPTNFIKDKPEIANDFINSLGLNKKLKNVSNVTETKFNIKDTIKSTGIAKNDTLNKNIYFKIADEKNFGTGNSRSLTGDISVNTKSLKYDSKFNLNQNITLRSAIVKNKEGRNEMKIQTDYPGVTFNEINNYELDSKINQKTSKEKNIWGLGVTVGYGGIFKNGVFMTGPSITAGLTFSPKLIHN